jgi:hypothetical protein
MAKKKPKPKPKKRARRVPPPRVVFKAPTNPARSNGLHPGGRSTKYHQGIPAMAVAGIKMRLTDEQICKIIGINHTTWLRWKHAHEEFRRAVTRTKEEVNETVEASLVQRAMGYSVTAVKIFLATETTETIDKRGRRRLTRKQVPVYAPFEEHIPAEVGAISLYLHNRDSKRWKRKVEPELPPLIPPEEQAAKQQTFKALLKLVEDNAKAGGKPIFAKLPAPVVKPGGGT